MVHNSKEVLSYWNDEKVESMYDKHLIGAEISLIRSRLKENTKVLDAGCGEGEGTLAYAKIKGVTVHAADFSATRLKKAAKRLKGRNNVDLFHVDFLGKYELDRDYDYIVSQRFLINLMSWDLQKKVLLDLMKMLKKKGKLLLLEGSAEGVAELNAFRKLMKLPEIEVKWHNLFLSDRRLKAFMNKSGFILREVDGLGEYFLLTRGFKPVFDKKPDWNDPYNRISASDNMKQLLRLGERFSRLKLWVFEK